MAYKEIESFEQFRSQLQESSVFENFAFQNINFTKDAEHFYKAVFSNCIFLGCNLPDNAISRIFENNYVFPQLNVPYNCHPAKLYTSEKLYDNYQLSQPESYKQCSDYKIYTHYLKNGKEAASIHETLARRLHDHAITDALYDFIENYPEKKIVAIMGGHALLRNDPFYHKIASLSKALSEEGFLMVTGGGPGAMEATHLGAWFANSEESKLFKALEILKTAPSYKDTLWLDTAFKVIKKHPKENNIESLGVPTWLYGHEPATPFATKIAKYFANSVREDGLLTIAKGGIIFSPGSAGTIQEIFQDATQNHYLSFGYASPMIFFGNKYWSEDFPVYPFIEKNLKNGNYKNLLLSKSDIPEEIIGILKEFSKH